MSPELGVQRDPCGVYRRAHFTGEHVNHHLSVGATRHSYGSYLYWTLGLMNRKKTPFVSYELQITIITQKSTDSHHLLFLLTLILFHSFSRSHRERRRLINTDVAVTHEVESQFVLTRRRHHVFQA